MPPMICGAHESVAGGLYRAIDRAAIDGCRAMQVFTKNSSMWREPLLTDEQIAAFRAAHAASGAIPVLAHTSYLINLATDKPDVLKKSVDALVAEVQRSSALGIRYVVLHPGAHLGFGEDAGVARAAECLGEVHERTAGASARICIENTAGQGSCVGHRFEHLGALFEQTPQADRMGVCFDTQHAFAAGYDLATPDGYERTWEAFGRIVGIDKLLAFHLNDSKKPLGSRVDRHEHLGEGILGLGLFWRLANDPRFSEVPGVVETEPREGDAPFKEEVALLNGLVGAQEPPRKVEVFSLEVVTPAAPKSRKTSR
jgi:deoxyribonuclease-4